MSSSVNDKSCLIIIPARKGSKRVLKKNVKHLNNKPLIEYSLEQCKKIKNVEILVSTNDQNIVDICKKNNLEVPFLRPNHLCNDNSSSRSIIIHALNYYLKKYKTLPDIVGLKPPTNPFIKHNSMELMIEKLSLSGNEINSCVSISETKTHPFRIVNLKKNHIIKNGIIKIQNQTINDIERSQDWPKTWEGSPALRITKSKFFLKEIQNKDLKKNGKTYDPNKSLGHIISKIEAFDIDDEFDFILAEAVAKKNLSKIM